MAVCEQFGAEHGGRWQFMSSLEKYRAVDGSV